jgi:hypothetical protein
VQFQAGRQRFLDLRQQRLGVRNDIQRRGGAGFQDRHQHGMGAVDMHDVGLRRLPSRICATSRI